MSGTSVAESAQPTLLLCVSVMPEWEQEHPAPTATLTQVADHVDHVRAAAGLEHIGIGGDYDGSEKFPAGLQDVSRYPALFAELLRRG